MTQSSRSVQNLLQPILPADSTRHSGAEPFPRASAAATRNTRVGSLELLSPQARDGGAALLSIGVKALVLSLIMVYLPGGKLKRCLRNIGPSEQEPELTHDLSVEGGLPRTLATSASG